LVRRRVYKRLHSLFFPQGGYLQAPLRLVALLAQPFPLRWAPLLFVVVALIIQTLTATFLVSGRMSPVWPSLWGRFLFAFIYVALPNSWETHLNLTNAQWHLAILAFLVLVSQPAESRLGRAGDLFGLALSGLSGPFCAFLLPLAVWEFRGKRTAAHLQRVVVVAIACAIQGGVLLATWVHSRSGAALGASGGTLARIIAVQILAGGLLGAHAMERVLQMSVLNRDQVAIAVALGGSLIGAVALWRGPPVLRKAAVFAGLLFAAVLWRPQVSLTDPQWLVMTNPYLGQRYYLIPMLAWIGVVLTLATDRNRRLRYVGSGLVLVLIGGIALDWFYPRLPATDFPEKTREFALAPPGTRVELPQQPADWKMVLIKRAP
jgi:hypothetical protein